MHRFSIFSPDAGGSTRARSAAISVGLLVLALIVVVGAVLVVRNSGSSSASDTPFPTPTTETTPTMKPAVSKLNAACRKLSTYWASSAEITGNGGKPPSGSVLPAGKASATCTGVVSSTNTVVAGPVVALTYTSSATAYSAKLTAAGWTASQAAGSVFIWSSAKYPKLLIDTRLDGKRVQVLVAGPLTAG